MGDTVVGAIIVGSFTVVVFVGRWILRSVRLGYEVPRLRAWGIGCRDLDEVRREAEELIDEMTEVE